MLLYQCPTLYATLLGPDVERFEQVCALIDRFLTGPRESIMDPACGPGEWLSLFGTRGWRLAGNDLSPPMVRAARRRLGRFPCEVQPGDMRRLSFATAPFDVAAEVSGVVCELPDPEPLAGHLASVAAHLRPGGLYIFVFIYADGTLSIPSTGYRSQPAALPTGGTASIAYRFVHHDARRSIVEMERSTRVVSCEGEEDGFTDRYHLRLHPPDTLERVIARVTELKLVTVLEQSEDAGDGDGLCEGMVVARKR